MRFHHIIDALPSQVYIGRGELIIRFSSIADLVSRVLKTAAALAKFGCPEPSFPQQPARPETWDPDPPPSWHPGHRGGSPFQWGSDPEHEGRGLW